MPWQETCTVELREKLVLAVLSKAGSVAELCRRAGVSRKTAYKWMARYKAGGTGGLSDRSRGRHEQPQRVSAGVLDEVLVARQAHPTWGARKLHKRLGEVLPAKAVPCISTIGAILAAAELTRPRGKRRHPPLQRPAMYAEAREPNDVVTIDFKGQFKLLTGQECYPLTVRDDASRLLMDARAMPSTALEGVVTTMQRLFGEHGLPRCIRSDNGSPFAGNGLARLSQLNVWWLRLGIAIDLITPGRPGENGSHEQMHRVLKAEATRPPRATMRDQQRAFDEFRRYYNQERYHEGIGMQRPTEVYRPSPRRYKPIKPGEQPEAEAYARHWETRMVHENGTIKLDDRAVFVSQTLTGCLVGLVEIEDRLWQLHFCRTLLGVIDTSVKRLSVKDVLATTKPGPTKLSP